jgi:hypothetical protein
MTLALMSCLLLAIGCSAPATSPGSPPLAAETPPTTRDPGTTKDVPPTPSSQPPPETGAGSTGGGGKAAGATCLAGTDCESGICEGLGCGEDTPGTCMAKARACTRDLRPYCGCDGKTFRTSGSCPGRRFSARAECPK